jgi:hypothetical protein
MVLIGQAQQWFDGTEKKQPDRPALARNYQSLTADKSTSDNAFVAESAMF